MSDSDHGLYELLFDRLARDESLSERCRELVLAAFEGEAELNAVISGKTAGSRPAQRHAEPSALPHMYLDAIRVQGFRGIGPAGVLRLRPGAGLTIVTGRNGSGKSSFAEAAEFVLTRDNKRWSAKENNKKLWRDGWRNLHGTQTGPACVGVDLMISGESGPTALRVTWPDGGDLDEGVFTRQRHGAKRETVTAALWPDELELYRPFLSYSELGALLDGRPTQLHAALYRLLGLGALDLTSERLKAIRGDLERAARTVKEERIRLADKLGQLADDRARRAEKLLRKPTPDLLAVSELALGDDNSAAEIATLRTLAALPFPTTREVTEAAGRIRSAVRRLDEVSTADTTRADEIAALLRLALAHQTTQPCVCPVCGIGTLDADWRQRATAQVRDLDDIAEQLRAAHQAVHARVADARLLVTSAPVVLTSSPAGVSTKAVLDAWHAWEQAGKLTDPGELADSLERTHQELQTHLGALREAAEHALSRLDEVWRPLAIELFAWHDKAQRVAQNADLLRDVKKVVAWLKDAGAELRDERMLPFARASQRIWAQLRQQSNVDIGAVRLTGSDNARKLLVDVAVDGTPGAALSVMSQGELHALALSLFLPRATVEQSPFRFLIIDDPVQAMDPAKVEGLARVLAEVARTRQVIVFTHDDRLPETVRRLDLDARVLQVFRRDGSVVEVRECDDRVTRYLDDARAIARTPQMPDDLKRELVATYCRCALEAAAQARFRAVRLRRGEPHAEVEQALGARNG